MQASNDHMKMSSKQQQEEASNPMSTDPSILSFGSDVACNDDLRRSIQAQVEEIEKSASNLRESIKAENQQGEQLRKNRVHAENETAHLLEGSLENAETVKMNSHILQGLDTTAKAELCLYVDSSQMTDSFVSSQPGGHRHQQPQVGREGSENAPPTTSGLNLNDVQTVHSQTISDFQSLKADFYKKTQEVQGLKAGLKQHEEFLLSKSELLEKENLEGRLSDLLKKIEDAKVTLDAENQRTSSLQSSVDAIIAQSNATEKLLTEKTNALNTMKSDFAARQVQMTKKQEDLVAEEARQKKHLEDLTQELETLVSTTNSAESQHQEAQQIIQSREEKKKLHAEIRAERLKLVGEKGELEKSLVDVKEKLVSQRQALTSCKETAALLAEHKTNLAAEYANKAEPDRDMIDKIRDEIIVMKRRLDEIDHDTGKDNWRKTLEEDKAKAEELKKTLQALEEERTAKKEVLCKQERGVSKLEESFQKELQSVETLIMRSKQETNAELERIAAEQEAARKRSSEATMLALQRKLNILRRGANMLEEATRKEEEYLDLEKPDVDDISE